MTWHINESPFHKWGFSQKRAVVGMLGLSNYLSKIKYIFEKLKYTDDHIITN